MSDSSSPSIPVAAEWLLDNIEKRLAKTESKQFLDEELLSLHSVFGTVLERALGILEKYPVFVAYKIKYNPRTLIEIPGEHDRCYRVFPRLNYCPCPSFKHQVLERKAQVLCKHVLAGRLAQILDRITVHVVDKRQYWLLIHTMYMFEE